MRRLFALTVGLALCTLFAHAESDTLKNKKQILRVVSKMEKQESLLLNYEIAKKNRRLANKLSKLSSNGDLVSLTENNNPTVFCISYLILAKRKDPFVDLFYLKYSKMTEAEWISWSRQINRINKKHKSDVVILYDNANFVYDVMNSGKFIDQIK